MPLARSFWDGTSYAVIGLHAPGRTLVPMFVKALESAGKTLWLVDAETKPLGGRTVMPSLEGAPPLDGALILCAPSQAKAAVEACLAVGVPRIWLDTRGNSSEAASVAKAAGVPCVVEACPLMTIPGAMWLHGIHGRLAERFGRLD